MSWQPIRTAPRNGAPVLVWCKKLMWTGLPAKGVAYYAHTVWKLATIHEGDCRFEIVDPILWWDEGLPPEPTEAEKELT